MKNKYIIIDGNSFIHRAYNALPPFTNSKGFPTNILVGVSNMIGKIKKDYKDDKLIVVFDAKGKNFRHKISKDYKANRNSMKEDMIVQLEPLKLLISAWGIPMVSIDGVEADDTMSTLALKAKEKGYDVIMATSDKDMNQIVCDGISILDTKSTEKNEKIELLDREGVKEKMGVYPERVRDFLALVGDNIDNIKGVNKCGQKTASKWIEEYGDLDNIIKNADKIKGKVGEYLRESIENGDLDLSYKLVTIKTDVDVDDIDSYIGQFDNEKLLKILSEYELNNLKKELIKYSGLVDSGVTEHNIKIDFSPWDKERLDLFKSSQVIFAETLQGENILLVSNEHSENAYVLDLIGNKKELNQLIKMLLKKESCISSLNSKEVLKFFHKVKNDISVFSIETDDMKVYDYIENGGLSKMATSSYLNDKYSNFNLSETREKYKIDTNSPKFEKMNDEEKIEILLEDMSICRFMFKNKSSEVNKIISDIDNRMLGVLAYMENTGVIIDRDYLLGYKNEIEVLIKEKEKEIFELSGSEFNINSPKQVSKVLFEDLNIESKKKSTAETVLKGLKDQNPIIEKILDYRSLSLLKSTYIDGLLDKADENGLINTTYNSTITKTGRLSSSNPNLQNIPIKTEFGEKIRKSFIPRKGFKYLKFDYSQIELMILAILSNDKNLLYAFEQDIDVHKLTISKILKKKIEEVTVEERVLGKKINFAIIYGIGDKNLAIDLGVERKESKRYIKEFFNYYQGVKEYFDNQLEIANKNLYVETILKRKISTIGLSSSNSHIRSYEERIVKNSPIQGTASELMKEVMIKSFDLIVNSGLDDSLKMVMQVHDELVFEVKENKIGLLSSMIKTIMENTSMFRRRLKVDLEILDNYK